MSDTKKFTLFVKNNDGTTNGSSHETVESARSAASSAISANAQFVQVRDYGEQKDYRYSRDGQRKAGSQEWAIEPGKWVTVPMKNTAPAAANLPF